MVERRIELDRRYARKKKMKKLNEKLTTATGEDREKVLYKIKRLSPFWTEAGVAASAGPKTEGASAPKARKAPSKTKKS